MTEAELFSGLFSTINPRKS